MSLLVCIEVVKSLHFYTKSSPLTTPNECLKLINVNIKGAAPTCVCKSVPYSMQQKASFNNHFVPENS
jgi:hypothetical protein